MFYSACSEIYNAGPYAATLTLTLTPLGPNGQAYVVSPIGQQTRRIEVGTDLIGCGIPTVVDYDSTHKDATRYRLRVDAAYDDGFTGSMELDAAISYFGTAAPDVVITKFRIGGQLSDAFIEIQNVSSVPVDMTRVYVDRWTPRVPESSSIFTIFRPFRGTIGPGCHWLIAGVGVNSVLSSIDGVLSDGGITVQWMRDGGLALRFVDGKVIDQVGMSPDSLFKEGLPLAPVSPAEVYTRVSDTGNNAADFRLGATAGARNSSTCTPPFQ